MEEVRQKVIKSDGGGGGFAYPCTLRDDTYGRHCRFVSQSLVKKNLPEMGEITLKSRQMKIFTSCLDIIWLIDPYPVITFGNILLDSSVRTKGDQK